MHGRGVVLLRGLPIQGLDFTEIAAMYWGLGAHIGNAQPQNTRGHFLRHFINLGTSFDNLKCARLSH